MLITSSSSPLSGYFSYVFFYSFYICLCLIFYVSIYILEVTLPYEPVCTSVSLGWWVGLSANISYKGREVSLTCSYRLSDFPMNPHVRLSVGWLVCLSVIISSFTSHAPIGLFIHMVEYLKYLDSKVESKSSSLHYWFIGQKWYV